MVKFSKFCSESLHGDADRRCCVEFREIYPTGNWAKSCVIYLENKQNFGCLSNYCADGAQNLPRPASNNVLTVLLTSSKWFHVWRSYSRTREDRFCPVEYFHNWPRRLSRQKKTSSSEETVRAIVREGSPKGRSETTVGRICETGIVLSREWKSEGVMGEPSGESKEEKVVE